MLPRLVGGADPSLATRLLWSPRLAEFHDQRRLLVDTDSRYQRDDWRGVAHALGPATQRRVVLISPISGLVPLQVYLPGLHRLSGSTKVRELDLVQVPTNVVGGGIGPPTRLTPGQPLPDGFTVASIRYTDTYTVVRLTAPVPTTVDQAIATAKWLGPLRFGGAVQAPVR